MVIISLERIFYFSCKAIFYSYINYVHNKAGLDKFDSYNFLRKNILFFFSQSNNLFAYKLRI